MRKLRKAEVEWVDSATDGTWQHPDQYKHTAHPPICHSIGYVVVNDRERVVLVQSQSNRGHVTDSIAIPKACVVKLRYIRDGIT